MGIRNGILSGKIPGSTGGMSFVLQEKGKKKKRIRYGGELTSFKLSLV